MTRPICRARGAGRSFAAIRSLISPYFRRVLPVSAVVRRLRGDADRAARRAYAAAGSPRRRLARCHPLCAAGHDPVPPEISHGTTRSSRHFPGVPGPVRLAGAVRETGSEAGDRRSPAATSLRRDAPSRAPRRHARVAAPAADAPAEARSRRRASDGWSATRASATSASKRAT